MAEAGITEYLREQAARQFEWNVSDCATLVIGWFDILSGKDGMAAWSGIYDSGETCDTYLASMGGIEAAADEFLNRQYDAKRTIVPKQGNAVLARYNGVDAMGIRADKEMIAFRLARGVSIVRSAGVVAEWTL
jgi:hypothetical protein